MGIIDKIEELTTKSVTPEEFKKTWGYGLDEFAADMIAYKRKLQSKKTAKVQPMKGKTMGRIAARPIAAAAIDLDVAATPKVADRAAGGKKRSTAKTMVKVKIKDGVIRVESDKAAKGLKTGIVIKTVTGVERPQLGIKKLADVGKGLGIETGRRKVKKGPKNGKRGGGPIGGPK